MNIFAIVVTFHPDSVLLSNLLRTLSVQCAGIIVSNNGGEIEHVINGLALGICSSERINLIDNHANIGIAAAQNVAISMAIHNGATHLVFFDQDSVIDDFLVLKLAESFTSCAKLNKVAALGPIYTDEINGFTYPVIKLNSMGFRDRIIPKENSGLLSTSFIISSGMFTSVEIINAVGFMDEELFIDYVDTEWCLRCLNQGFVFYVDTNIQMKHTIGNGVISLLHWNLPVHSPARRYYRIRNAMLLFSKSHVPFILKLREVIINAIHQALIVVSSDRQNRMPQLSIWFKAMSDGVMYLVGRK